MVFFPFVNAWQWTMMAVQPDWITPEIVGSAIEGARKTPGVQPDRIHFERFAEGLAVQTLHIGPYREEAPTIARLHGDYLPCTTWFPPESTTKSTCPIRAKPRPKN